MKIYKVKSFWISILLLILIIQSQASKSFLRNQDCHLQLNKQNSKIQQQQQDQKIKKISQIQPQDIKNKIQWLYQRLNKKHYWKNNQKFKLFTTWQHMKGLYSSNVHFNLLDPINSIATQTIRNRLRIDDVNMFVTSFVLYGLLEAQQLKTIQIDHHQFSQSLEALTNFKDKNVPYGIPQYVFWPQQYVNGTWSAKSVNLVNVIDMAPSFPHFMDGFLDKIGLGLLTQIKNIVQYFVIPPDNDDSSVNIALQGYLKQVNSSHYNFWHSFNFNKKEYYNQALKYAYRPFQKNYSRNKRADQIDSRTYFALWKFIDLKRQEALKNNQQPSLILPTTWILNRDQQIQGAIVMPFDTNNVDASVCANFLFGLSYQVLFNGIQMNHQLSQMALNTAQLLKYVIQNIVQKRPDIILLYYPSKYDFYWFIARTVALYKRHQNKLVYPLTEIYSILKYTIKITGTNNLYQNRKQTNDGCTHWSEFLGNYAGKQRNDDTLFSTALAMNALFDIWTNRDKNDSSKIYFDEDTPQKVKQALKRGALYLMKNAKQGMKQSNVFFSGSVKVFKTSFPYFYPANIHTDAKGNNIDPQTQPFKGLPFHMSYYFKGTVSSQQYQKMIKQKWFGYNVPQFRTYNEGVGISFPYWSSKAITEIMMISSLSKYLRTAQSNKI